MAGLKSKYLVATDVGGTCTDKAGNVGTASFGLQYDASAPTGVTAVAADSMATVGWTPPVSDGGAPITSYRLTPFIGSDPKGLTRPVHRQRRLQSCRVSPHGGRPVCQPRGVSLKTDPWRRLHTGSGLRPDPKPSPPLLRVSSRPLR